MESLDILIPTYNRASILYKNLNLLGSYIPKLPVDNVKIIVSNNASTDNTAEVLSEYRKKNQDINLIIITQPENTGVANLRNIVSYSKAEYVILLGDDDFLDLQYLMTAINAINTDPQISCILPSCELIDGNGNKTGVGRDLGLPQRIFNPGVESVKLNSIRAHQMSGIILLREGLFQALKSANIDNMYPQIFMAAWECLRGKCLHLPQWPVKVTDTNKKYWAYDEIGLLNDMFQNIARLGLSDKERYEVEKYYLTVQRQRFLYYWKNPVKQIKVINKVTKGPNTSQKGSVLLPHYMVYIWLRYILSNIYHKLRGK